ncbi:BA14K family protein [Terrihabitans sp. B22-R8]|uniref:BA14K family protein n=1 Tax=Terrihabitans sp. B22-R8 TaxID=3425128 RepID=UPI00403C9798
MLRIASATALAAALIGSTFLMSSPADAQRGQSNAERHRQVERYCARNPRDRDCRNYRRGGRHSDETLGSLFNKAGRAVVGGARAVGQTIANTACDVRYKTYDRRTNTYVGRDGRRHRCD